MLAALLLLETLSIVLFAALLTDQQTRRVERRSRERLAYEARSMALQAREALDQDRPGWVGLSVKMMGEAPTVAFAKVSDPAGNVLFVSNEQSNETVLDPAEMAQIPQTGRDESRVFTLRGGRLEAVCAIYTGNDLRAYAWVEYNQTWAREELNTLIQYTAIFGIIWLVASSLLVLLVWRAIDRPLAILHRGTRALMKSPESGGNFPLPVTVENEFGDLIQAFNRMVASIAEQRSGLNDTLSLLDSMLANAPIGLAFFDRRCRFVRVNQVFAGMTGAPVSRHLGRTLPELLRQPAAQQLEDAVQHVFADEEPVRHLELSGEPGKLKWPSTWLASVYPVRTTPNEVRWVGVIVLDVSERKRSEDALRKTEKLAVTGRLAASIAHEINNPLEGITNLLFLLRNFSHLEDPALKYVAMAEDEVRRIAEITQQTLRFYRQSTLPTRSNMGELLNSVLDLHQPRLAALEIKVERDYDTELDLYCFAGEVRQVIANLVGNAIDATTRGGRLVVRARRSRSWKEPGTEGVRITVADTGAGMEPEVREHIFEPFFTTKSVTGTGLGLWVSHEIILKHHGMVRVHSRPASGDGPSGTTFQLFFPDHGDLTAGARQPAVAEA